MTTTGPYRTQDDLIREALKNLGVLAAGQSPDPEDYTYVQEKVDSVLRTLAAERAAGTADFASIHLFCFGGYLRTCEWLHRVAAGAFTLNASGGFDIK